MLSRDPTLVSGGVEALLVIGDLILDRYVSGTTSRVSPEAPVPIVDQNGVHNYLGGAANLAANLAAMGVNVFLSGTIGDDEEGQQLMDLLAVANVDSQLVRRVSGRPTSLKTRITADGQHIVRIDREDTGCLSQIDQENIGMAIKHLLPLFNGVLFSDYNKGFLTPFLVSTVVHETKMLGKNVIADAKLKNFRKYEGITAMTPNFKELQSVSGRDFSFSSDMDTAARELMANVQLSFLLVTCGENGVVLYGPENRKHYFPNRSKDVYDVNGAGDSAFATFAWSLLVHNESPERAAQLANHAGAIAVSKLGTSTITEKELLSYDSDETISSQYADKALSLEEVLIRIKILRQAERPPPIIFTNGCFDLLHAGHVEYLQRMKALGGILIVGLNTDSSVRQLKGNRRPIVPEAERVQALTALNCIDHVVLFGEETPMKLIQAIQPDILAKGCDYQVHQVVGHDFVTAYGGRVELFPLKPGVSTTNVIEKIVDRYRETLAPVATPSL